MNCTRQPPAKIIFFGCAIAALTILSFSAHAAARVRQTIGPTYEILEPSIYADFQALLEQKKASGELAKIEKEGRARAEDSMRNPSAVEGIRIAREARSWTYDPSVVATNDVRDHNGSIIVAKGTSVSPLDQMSWKPMVFFDQRDPSQVAMAQRLLKEWGGRGKPVLVGGSWVDLTKNWKQQIYFDQQGTLVKRFGIRAVPATVVQHERVLKVSELPVSEVSFPPVTSVNSTPAGRSAQSPSGARR
jgi:conjugal transfer pilus assembly protein TraW